MMLLKQLALAASATAFLVVPERPSSKPAGDDEQVTTLPAYTKDAPVAYMAPQLEAVTLPCVECKDDSRLQLDFMVEDAARLTVNGYELYPKADPWHNDLVAPQVDGNGDTADQILGYALAVSPRIEDKHLELITVDLRVIEVGGRFVGNVPPVRVNLLKMRDGGEVFLNRVEVAHKVAAAGSLADRIKAKFDRIWGRVKSLGKCKHRKGMHHKHHHGKFDGQRSGHGSKAHHGHHGIRRDWRKLLKNISTNIVLPALTGITAGVGVIVLAMGICSIGAVLFASRRRRHRRSSRKNKPAPPSEAVFEDEKARLMEDVEAAPPTYEDEPARQDA